MEKCNKLGILIGAGENCSSVVEEIRQKQQEGAFITALDGGLVFCELHDIKPDYIVGDFDSLHDQRMLDKYPKDIICKLPCEKDDTDTLAAIKMLEEKGFTQFMICGGLGGRLSHTMANVQSLFYLKERGLHGELVGNNCRVFLIKDEKIILQSQSSGYISVFSYEEKAQGVTLKNLKYEVENVTLTNAFPIGVSNEFMGKDAEISVEKGKLLIIIEDV